jgi:uncharacterized protein (TIGR02118 family)
MIKVSVMYPNRPGARFDHDYYRDRHLPLIKHAMGTALQYYTIDKGLSGAAPGSPAAYVAMCHLLCDSLAAYHSGYDPHAREILKDISNFTDVTPVVQISEVVTEDSRNLRSAAAPNRITTSL